jgi:hypothetical protein
MLLLYYGSRLLFLRMEATPLNNVGNLWQEEQITDNLKLGLNCDSLVAMKT